MVSCVCVSDDSNDEDCKRNFNLIKLEGSLDDDWKY